MITIGLTGPTGSGKSTASKTAEKLGFQVIDCDVVARKAVEKGSNGLSALVTAFGDDILNCDETLNRKALAKKAFSTPENTEKLNRTLLPHIVLMVKEQTVGEYVLLDAPTLFESGMHSECDATVAVLADMNTRLSRIIERDSISEEDALLRINAGKDEDYYKDRADYILYNNADTDDFINEFERVINDIKTKGE